MIISDLRKKEDQIGISWYNFERPFRMIFFRFRVAFEFFWYCIRRPHRNGHRIHSPFLFAYLQEVVYSKALEDSSLSAIRLLKYTLSESKEIVSVADFGAGSHSLKHSQRKVSDISKRSSITHKYGKLLYRTVGYFKSEIIIELGTCLGFGSMYLASGNNKSKLFTMEGSEELVKKSKENFSQMKMDRITVVPGNFDDTLSSVFAKQPRVDLFFIDGNHRKTAVLNYFRQCLPYVTDDSVLIVDDIRWSEEMLEAWREICNHQTVTLSLDLFRLGIVFFNHKLKKQHFKIYY
jgi:predicted O-methyltransferase YrrM